MTNICTNLIFILCSDFTSVLKTHLGHPGDVMKSNMDLPEFYRYINQKDAGQNTALHIAVQAGTETTCQVLIQSGADVNIPNKSLHTPLHVAAIGKNREILEFLIKQGAETSSKDFKQKTPLHGYRKFKVL